MAGATGPYTAHAAALKAFDVEAVEQRAAAIVATGGATGVEEARKLFEETLSAWGDEYARLLEECEPPLAAPEVRGVCGGCWVGVCLWMM